MMNSGSTSRRAGPPQRAEAPYVADRRLYLDKDGKVVEADDPGRKSLLVAKGLTIPAERAKELGLMGGKPAKAEATKEEPFVPHEPKNVIGMPKPSTLQSPPTPHKKEG